jgi:BirA family biotin operon repressor/biotin-[acetyl-CoA-carboxylase] ligase
MQLDPAVFHALLKAHAGEQAVLDVRDSVTSTNAICIEYAAQHELYAPYICIASQQTAGRGRRGRVWDSPLAAGIYLSIAWRIADLEAWQGMSLAVGVAVIQALESVTGVSGLQLKWPNDILLGDGKLGGVLIEVTRDAVQSSVLVIGVGINCERPSDTGQTDNARAYLSEQVSSPVCHSTLGGALAVGILDVLQCFESLRFAAYRDMWEGYDAWRGRDVVLLSGDNVIAAGIESGVNAVGELLILQEGVLKPVNAGELSLRLAR